VTEVVIAARDSVSGYCGEEFTLQLPRTLAPYSQTLPPEPTSVSPESYVAPSFTESDTSTAEPTAGSSLVPSSTLSDDSSDGDALTVGDTSDASGRRVSVCSCLLWTLLFTQLL